jgi:NNP family nitrate/nitrite transporter-like MFS transporter
MVLFITTGIGNGSTFRMIPVIFMTERLCAVKVQAAEVLAQARKDAAKESSRSIRFQFSYSGLRRILYPQELRYGNQYYRKTGCGAVLLYCFLYHVYSDYVVELRAQKCGNILLILNSILFSPYLYS